MKMLLSTTALAFALGFPTLALSESAASAADQSRTQQAAAMPGFLATRGQSDVFASDLIGHDVYARRSPADKSRADGKSNRADGRANTNADGTHGMARMNRADLDDMDNIGQINEIVLSNDGRVRALVIGVGGFLGMGERDVAVTMDQVTFASSADDRSKMYIIVKPGKDVLKNSPAYDRTSMRKEGAAGNAETRADRTRADRPRADRTRAYRSAFAAPKIARDGYKRVDVSEVSTEILIGKSVYDVNDKDVGTVKNMIIDDAGTITNVIVDFGGFLGIGQSHISMGFDELTILSNAGYKDVRVYVDATKEQIQDRPRYEAKR